MDEKERDGVDPSEDGNNAQKDGASRLSLAYSLTRLTPEMITPSAAADQSGGSAEKRSALVRRLILLVSVCVFLWSLWSIVDTMIGYRKAEEFYGDLVDRFENEDYAGLDVADSPTPPFGTRREESSSAVDRTLFERMKSRLYSLAAVNPDICGWINIPGTKNINYPILQGEDNEYYLDHEYTGGWLAAGSIFVDCTCDRDFNGNYNTVIYGHNMQNGMMFSELINYLDEKFFNEHEYVYVYTVYGVYTYRVYAVFKANYQYRYFETSFEKRSDFVDFAYEMKANSLYEREGIEFDENSRVITLSTCTNQRWTDRYCIQALLVDAYNE